jgi:FAD/FMN-containing dehydrogenase
VLLDLRTLNRVNPYVDGTQSVVTAEPGASWGSVYAALDPYNRSVIGARDEDVGVGGLILGGGMPYFSNRYGLASDNVQNFQVCTQTT